MPPGSYRMRFQNELSHTNIHINHSGHRAASDPYTSPATTSAVVTNALSVAIEYERDTNVRSDQPQQIRVPHQHWRCNHTSATSRQSHHYSRTASAAAADTPPQRNTLAGAFLSHIHRHQLLSLSSQPEGPSPRGLSTSADGPS